ncbi:FecR family protein [Paludibacter sp. 221]|uniref:FecR family protein n=1 Tax=Paludibacter sp. 221 TaxID=2302939 RepID=UPI0013D46FAF|nr:FecR family protein [Paludibacter sp. 221]NDV47228.1 FecR family protein [Paludibacter sp. 221]
MSDEIDILLSRYFSGEATRQELGQLDSWLAQSAEHEAYFDKMTMLYQQMGTMGATPKPNMEKALLQFNTYINSNDVETVVKKEPKRRLPLLRYAVAASIVLLVGVFTFVFLNKPDEIIQIATLNAPEKYELLENTEVLLASNSEIKYSSAQKNEVELKGKAVFTVKQTEKKQLTVLAGETFIKDIGTVFTVTAYDTEHSVLVEVEEGEVLFYTLDNAGIRVRENEKAYYNSQTKEFGFLETMEETLDEIIFNATPLGDVADVLTMRYGVDITLSSSTLRDLQISVSFDKNESLENVLQIITETLSLKFTAENNGFVISY